MFIAGNPKLVIEQCKAGIVGSFPALNARPKEALEGWLTEIETALAGRPQAAPYAVISGAVASGSAILAAQAAAADIVYTDLFSGVHGNYLKHSVLAAGFDPLNLPKSDPAKMNFGATGGAEKKVWRDIWSAGQGVGQIDAVMPVAQVVDRLAAEYVAARQRLQIN